MIFVIQQIPLSQIQFNLADFTRRAYGTNYVETLRVQIHANCRIRRVYFSDRYVGYSYSQFYYPVRGEQNIQFSRLYSEDELPAEFKLYLPVQQKQQAQQQMSQQMLQQQQQQLQNEQMMAAAGTSGSGGGGENDI